MTAERAAQLGRYGAPDEVADLVYFLLSDYPRYRCAGPH